MKRIMVGLFGSLMLMGLCSLLPVQANQLKSPVTQFPVTIQAAKTIKKSGGKYYGYRDGKLMKNTFTTVDGYYYYFNDKGIAITSQWKTINSKKYYFGSNGRAYTGAKKVGSYIYGFSSSGSLLKDYGYKKIDGKYYYFDANGKSIKGFYKAGSYYRYFNGDGTVATAEFKTINNKLYYFTKDGVMCTSEWKNIKNELGLSSSKFISCDENGVVRKGLHEVVVDGVKNLYYFDKDLSRGVKTGVATIDGEIYYFKAKGEAAKGLYKVGKYYYFFKEDGTAERSKWVEVNKKRYYMASNGRSYVNCIKKVGSYTYYFTSSGYVHIGYKAITENDETKYYYFNSKGRSRVGLLQVPDKDYKRYFYGNGNVAKAEFKAIDGKMYYFTKDGIMCTSPWKNIRDELGLSSSKFISCDENGVVREGFHELEVDGVKNLYYLDKDLPRGVKTGLETIDGKIYFFKAAGEAAKDLYKVDGTYYYFKEDGSAVCDQWVKVDGKRYYMDENGRSYMNCMKKIGDATYYFTSSGAVQTGYKSITTGTKTEYYFFDEDGKSQKGLFKVPNKDYSRYFNGDGTVATAEFKEFNNNLYFFTSAGLLCQSEWRNIKTDLGIDEATYVACDPKTGIVKQGYTEVNRDGKDYIFYLDKDAPHGYRTGKQDCGKLGTYYFAVDHGNQGYLRTGIITETETKSIYYCDPKTKKMLLNGTHQFEGTDISFEIGKDGKLQFDTELLETDNGLTKFLKVCFSQLFKDYGHLSIGKMKQMDLDEIPGYSCSGYVLRMLYEVFGPEDIVGTNHDIAYTIYEQREEGDTTREIYSPSYGMENLEIGDFIFINKNDCYTSVDDLGDPMIIDLNNDGICDREHKIIEGNDGAGIYLHVHHVGIYIGNGMYINSMPHKGVVIQKIPEDGEIEYISAVARISFDYDE